MNPIFWNPISGCRPEIQIYAAVQKSRNPEIQIFVDIQNSRHPEIQKSEFSWTSKNQEIQKSKFSWTSRNPEIQFFVDIQKSRNPIFRASRNPEIQHTQMRLSPPNPIFDYLPQIQSGPPIPKSKAQRLCKNPEIQITLLVLPPSRPMAEAEGPYLQIPTYCACWSLHLVQERNPSRRLWGHGNPRTPTGLLDADRNPKYTLIQMSTLPMMPILIVWVRTYTPGWKACER